MSACLCVSAAVLVYALECFAVTGVFLHAFDGFSEWWLNPGFPLVVCELSKVVVLD
jgi:hypothetical protein